MQTVFMRGLGEMPAKKAIDVKVGDKLVFAFKIVQWSIPTSS